MMNIRKKQNKSILKKVGLYEQTKQKQKAFKKISKRI